MISFPTLAEQAKAEFDNSKVTISLVTICNRMGAERRSFYDTGKVIEYTFEDDTSLQIRGAGKSHRVETFLP